MNPHETRMFNESGSDIKLYFIFCFAILCLCPIYILQTNSDQVLTTEFSEKKY